MSGLSVLRIRDLAVVEHLELELESGLTVITGETGSGKSILIRAIELVLGARATPDLVRTGAERAEVEALFVDPAGVEHVVRRTVRVSGRSRAYVDGNLCTVAVLQDRVRGWVDISSQHEHTTLTDPRTHLDWLDRFAATGPLLDRCGTAFDAARSARKALDTFRAALRDRAERLDLLRFQLGEIERVQPEAGELDGIHEALHRLTHAETLRDAANVAAEALHGERTAVNQVVRAEDAIHRVIDRDPALQAISERLETTRIELEDLAAELSNYAASCESDPGALAELHDRERALQRLIRRHGSIEDAIRYRDDVRSEIEDLEDADGRLETLAEEASVALSEVARAARELSETRRRHARQLAAAVSEQLGTLGMGHARIEVEVEPLAPSDTGLEVDGNRLSAKGFDRAEFLIAPNPGESPRALSKVASGGELSRSLLALKHVLVQLGPAGTYVFDEVDTGVGGAVAEAIGRKLQEVSRHAQVLCITHQAVIAARADHHLEVHKLIREGRTTTQVHRLTAPEREEELARMLGGEVITPGVRQAARELLGGPP